MHDVGVPSFSHPSLTVGLGMYWLKKSFTMVDLTFQPFLWRWAHVQLLHVNHIQDVGTQIARPEKTMSI